MTLPDRIRRLAKAAARRKAKKGVKEANISWIYNRSIQYWSTNGKWKGLAFRQGRRPRFQADFCKGGAALQWGGLAGCGFGSKPFFHEFRPTSESLANGRLLAKESLMTSGWGNPACKEFFIFACCTFLSRIAWIHKCFENAYFWLHFSFYSVEFSMFDVANFCFTSTCDSLCSQETLRRSKRFG